MSNIEFVVNLSPEKVFNIVRSSSLGNLVHSELNNLENGKYIGVAVFEKFFFRVESKATLVIIIKNVNDNTSIKAIGTGGGHGIFGIDWGANSSFATEVRKLFKDHIVEKKWD